MAGPAASIPSVAALLTVRNFNGPIDVRPASGGDVELRAALFAACMVGLGMSRYMIKMEPVASASPADLHRLMEPVLKALVDPPA